VHIQYSVLIRNGKSVNICLYDSHALARRYMITESFHEAENIIFPSQELHSSICTYLFASQKA
jgi:hypothetical protein